MKSEPSSVPWWYLFAFLQDKRGRVPYCSRIKEAGRGPTKSCTGGKKMPEYLLGQLEDLPERRALLMRLEDCVVGAYRVGQDVRIYENVCPHLGGPVCQGEIVDWVEEVVGRDGEVVGQRVVPGRQHIV